MGTWGSGNFDNDAALDYLHEFVQPLVAQLAEVVANPALAEADEFSDQCMATVELLTVLSQYYTSEQLSPQLVQACRATMLAQWEATIDDMDPDPAYKAERRLVMQQAFDRLLAAVQR